MFICLRPTPLLSLCLGWSRNFVGSESGQIQSVKLLQNMISNRTPSGTFCLRIVEIRIKNVQKLLLLFKMFISSKQCMTFYIIFLRCSTVHALIYIYWQHIRYFFFYKMAKSNILSIKEERSWSTTEVQKGLPRPLPLYGRPPLGTQWPRGAKIKLKIFSLYF